MQHSWNTRSIRRKRPLSTFSTCPRSCRARQAAETDFQEVLAAGRIFEVSEIVRARQAAETDFQGVLVAGRILEVSEIVLLPFRAQFGRRLLACGFSAAPEAR